MPVSTPPPAALPKDTGIQAARPLELFFDLVFVFAISQFTRLVAHPHGWADYLQAGLAFVSATWVYTAYVWLTSNIRLEESELERWNLLLGMLCFFGLAVGIPPLAKGHAELFVLSFLAAMLLQIVTFSRAGTSSSAASNRFAPLNLASGLLVCVAGFLPTPWRWVLWGAALIANVYFVQLSNRSPYSFSLSPRHFVERHGLVVIIALGEGVMGLGNGVTDEGFSYRVLAYTLSGLLLLATLWWAYFGLNQHAAEHRLVSASLAQRPILAGAFGLAHFPLLAGCILVAASLEVGVHHPLGHIQAATVWNMGVGVALYFVGLIFMRWRLELPLYLHLWGGFGLALLSAFVGLRYGALWQVVALVATLLWMGFSKVPAAADL